MIIKTAPSHEGDNVVEDRGENLLRIINLALSDDDNDEWEAYGFSVLRFSTSAFDSTYKCFKVKNHGELILDGRRMPDTFVVKKTDQWENEILQFLRHMEIPVPEIYLRLVNRGNPKSTSIILMEEYCEGKDIWESDEVNAWKDLGMQIAKVHNLFLNKSVPRVSDVTNKRIHGAQIASAEDGLFRLTWIAAMKRLKNMPATLIHGDLFATNAITTEIGIKIIDWADSGSGAYAMDLGRFTATIDPKTYEPFCKYPNEFLNAYYTGIQDIRSCTYSEFMLDVYAGQFMEVASYYDPSVLHEYIWDDDTVKFAKACKEKMEELSKMLLS